MTPVPAPLQVDAARRRVLASGWRSLEVVEVTGSTNADLVARAVAGHDIGGAVLAAEHQTAGRGRNGRGWTAMPGAGIIVSVGVATAQVPPARWGRLPLLAGLAVTDALAGVPGVTAPLGVKWPNDVLVGDDPPTAHAGGKLAGILAEVAAGPTPVVVLGIGINVAGAAPAVAQAVSLADLGAHVVDRTALLGALLDALAARVAAWRGADGADDTAARDYRRRSITLGRAVRAELPGGATLEGLARDVDDVGRLLVDTADGVVAVAAGDVVHLRGV